MTSSAVSHDLKKSNRQSLFNFQDILDEGKNLPNLDVEFPVWFDALERFYRPETWYIFGRFLTLFPLKRPARREKNTSNMAATVYDIIDDVTCKCSMLSRGIHRLLAGHAS
jgi:hypothetical protein